MSNSGDQPTRGTVAEVIENLGAVFRHLLPGVLILGAARIIRPSWFIKFDASSWSHLALVGVVAIIVGNAWFSLNRYGLYQLVDYACWMCRSQGPARTGSAGYLNHLAAYVRETVVLQEPARARQHVGFRVSSVLLIYTISVLAFAAAVGSEEAALTHGHWILLPLAGAILLVAGVWQHVITRRIDAALLHDKLVP